MKHTNAYVTTAIAAVGIALVGPPVHAQKLGRVGGSAVAPAPVVGSASPHRAASTGTRAKGVRNMGTRSTASTSNIATRQRADAFGFQDLLDLTPNNGFNYQFVNSINQDLPIKAFIDPVTEIEVAQAERLLRNTGGGAFGGSYILGGGGYYYPPEAEGGPPNEEPPQNGEPQPTQAQQPQVIVLQQAPGQQQSAQPGGEAPAAEEQVPDEGEFTLVLRNGKQIEAVAFTRADDKFVYITPGGGRLSIDASDLDPDATVRINQERGTPMQLPL